MPRIASELDRIAYEQMRRRLEDAESAIESAYKNMLHDGENSIADALDCAVAELRVALFDMESVYVGREPVTPLPTRSANGG